ncbi:uncharacterized protein EV422DRAFT_536485 [Fimicolochytrium jonesii]|uniref:uncharacterized protein n=1 Tax=Fimicolochytrium jonesii TaxID=1396493 RepID=UPI0022FDF906|nr:uncharacterized protein EV422DRAFT_536485 [Fimicolochytrium jonesii]KAI8818680.1 hypothetical protein EV422DRAFT_536485 [Fimicolochytrium jonesii]
MAVDDKSPSQQPTVPTVSSSVAPSCGVSQQLCPSVGDGVGGNKGAVSGTQTHLHTSELRNDLPWYRAGTVHSLGTILATALPVIVPLFGLAALLRYLEMEVEGLTTGTREIDSHTDSKKLAIFIYFGPCFITILTINAWDNPAIRGFPEWKEAIESYVDVTDNNPELFERVRRSKQITKTFVGYLAIRALWVVLNAIPAYYCGSANAALGWTVLINVFFLFSIGSLTVWKGQSLKDKILHTFRGSSSMMLGYLTVYVGFYVLRHTKTLQFAAPIITGLCYPMMKLVLIAYYIDAGKALYGWKLHDRLWGGAAHLYSYVVAFHSAYGVPSKLQILSFTSDAQFWVTLLLNFIAEVGARLFGVYIVRCLQEAAVQSETNANSAVHKMIDGKCDNAGSSDDLEKLRKTPPATILKSVNMQEISIKSNIDAKEEESKHIPSDNRPSAAAAPIPRSPSSVKRSSPDPSASFLLRAHQKMKWIVTTKIKMADFQDPQWHCLTLGGMAVSEYCALGCAVSLLVFQGAALGVIEPPEGSPSDPDTLSVGASFLWGFAHGTSPNALGWPIRAGIFFAGEIIMDVVLGVVQRQHGIRWESLPPFNALAIVGCWAWLLSCTCTFLTVYRDLL